jgi:hypothetical protein
MTATSPALYSHRDCLQPTLDLSLITSMLAKIVLDHPSIIDLFAREFCFRSGCLMMKNDPQDILLKYFFAIEYYHLTI